jgi:hypothetical protein
MENRFNDQQQMLRDFGGTMLIKCPKCTRPIEYQTDPDNAAVVKTMACGHCGYIREGYTIDIYKDYWSLFFRNYELYFQASCCGQTLWANNLAHLNFLESYVEAKLRERVPNFNRSLASRLPQWIKSAKNREEILKCIRRMKEKYEKDKKK